jgi:O-antigen/teichoic acid export membrane protein
MNSLLYGGSMSSIRITYSGLIGLAVRLSSLITGMIFSIIITRNLVQEEFGLYALIGSLIAYAMFGHVISAYWVPRHIPRGEEVGKIALLTNGLFSLVGMLVYLITAYFVAQNTNSDFNILLLGSLLIPATYIANTLDGINQGFRPQAVSYSFIAFEIAKVPIGFLLLESFSLGLVGAIIATFLALLIKAGAATYFAFEHLKSAIDFSYMIRWLKLSWLSLYGIFAGNIYVLDTFIVTIFFHSTEPISYFAAATTISIVAGYAGILSKALGPKLIADTKAHHVQTVIRLYGLIGIPILIAVIVFAKPLLFLLNPAYSIAVPIVYFMSCRAFVYGIYTIFSDTLGGIEKVDTDENAKFSQYIKSNLFLLSTIQYVRTGIYLIPLMGFLLFAPTETISILDIVVVWSIFGLISELAITVYACYKVRQAKFLILELKPILKYLGFAVIAGLISWMAIDNFVIFERDLAIFLPGLAISLGIGAVAFFIPMYFIDDYCRGLLKTIFQKLT